MDEEPRPLEIEITVDLARILDEAKISYIYTGWTSMFCYVGPNIYGVSVSWFRFSKKKIPLLTLVLF